MASIICTTPQRDNGNYSRNLQQHQQYRLVIIVLLILSVVMIMIGTFITVTITNSDRIFSPPTISVASTTGRKLIEESGRLLYGSSSTTTSWEKGIVLSIIATIIGAISKLFIRKSWILLDPDHSSVSIPTTTTGTHENSNDYNINNNANNNGIPYHSYEYSRQPSTTTIIDGNHQITRQKQIQSMVLRYSGMIGMTILNPLCGLLAMQYLSPSICAPFSGLTIVWILLLSGPIVQEYPTQLQIISCIFLLISELLIAVFGDHTDGIDTTDNQTNDPLATFNTVYMSYWDPTFISYNVILLCWFGFLAYWICKDNTNEIETNHRINGNGSIHYNITNTIVPPPSTTMTATATTPTYTNPVTIITSEDTPTAAAATTCGSHFVLFGVFIEYTTIQKVCWGMAGGSVTSMLFFLKDALTIVSSLPKSSSSSSTTLLVSDQWYDTNTTIQQFDDDDDGIYNYYSYRNKDMDKMIEYSVDDKHPNTIVDGGYNSVPNIVYIFLGILMSMAILVPLIGLFLLSSCMKRYDATYSSAMFIGSYAFWASIMSCIHYHTFQHLRNYYDGIFYIIGILLLLFGVSILIYESSIVSKTNVTRTIPPTTTLANNSFHPTTEDSTYDNRTDGWPILMCELNTNDIECSRSFKGSSNIDNCTINAVSDRKTERDLLLFNE